MGWHDQLINGFISVIDGFYKKGWFLYLLIGLFVFFLVVMFYGKAGG